MALSPDDKVLRVAVGQRMLIARRQCYAAGLSLRQVRYRLQQGRWKQVHPDVFSIDGRQPEDFEGKVLAVVLAVRGAVASHRTALWLHGVRRLGAPDQIEVSAPHGCRVQLPDVKVHQRRSLPAEDRTVVRDVSSTTCARAILDLSVDLAAPDRIGVLDEALYAKATTRSHLLHRIRHAGAGRAGMTALVDLLDERAEQRFRSWLEAEASRIWREAGLPSPSWNTVLRDERGRIGEVDAVFPGGVVVVELDGPRFHSSPSQRRKDRARDRRLVLSGRIVLRFDWEDVAVRSPAVMVEQIRQALRIYAPPASSAGSPSNQPSTARS